MKRLFGALSVSFILPTQGYAKPPPARATARVPTTPAPHAEVRPLGSLPMLPSVARVRVEAARDRVVVVEEVNLPRGEWRSGGLDFYVAFGAPGTPLAVDARLVAVASDSQQSRPEDAGEGLAVQSAVRRPASAYLLLGRPQMAGVVVRARESDLRRAYAGGDLAAIRIRSLLPPAAGDSHGLHDVVVRLGIAGDSPLTLGHIQVVSLETQPWITRVEASLCGPEAEGLPLAVTVTPKAQGDAPARPRVGGPIAPFTAVRHASDDLCVRWWAGS